MTAHAEVEMTEEERRKAIESRVYNLNDTQLVHATCIAEHRVQIAKLESDVLQIRSTMATGEQLNHGMERLSEALKAAVTEMSLKLQLVHNDLDPIKRGIGWIVTLVLGAVVLALLALILGRPGTAIPVIVPTPSGTHP